MALEPWTPRGGVVVLTGAASGIGAALATNLARRGVACSWRSST